MNEQNDRPRVDWEEDKRFERDGFCVVVQKLPLRKPQYSVFVGRPMEKGISRYLPIYSKGQGQITVQRVSTTIFDLLEEAEDYIQSECQRQADGWVEEQQYYEQRSMNRGKKKGPVGLSGGPGSGKTARKRESRRKRMAGEA